MDGAIGDAVNDFDAGLTLNPTKHRYAATFRAQVNGDTSGFQHGSGSISLDYQGCFLSEQCASTICESHSLRG
jgi:hypothetical protein